MEEIQRSGKARAIGVSNFLPDHLDQLAETATVLPSINQVEFHPHLQSPELVAYCDDHNIVLEAWSPLKHGEIIDDPELQTIADAHGVTVPQVVLRWLLQRGIVAIPKERDPVTDRAERRPLRLRTEPGRDRNDQHHGPRRPSRPRPRQLRLLTAAGPSSRRRGFGPIPPPQGEVPSPARRRGSRRSYLGSERLREARGSSNAPTLPSPPDRAAHWRLPSPPGCIASNRYITDGDSRTNSPPGLRRSARRLRPRRPGR